MKMRISLIPITIIISLVCTLGLITNMVQSMSAGSNQTDPYLVKDIQLGINSSTPFGFVPANGKIYFTTGGAFSPDELGVSDGILTGTIILTDSIASGGMANLGEALIFGRVSNGIDYTLWKTDGTVTGTILVADLYDGSNPNQFTQAADLVFFEAPGTTSSNRQLWRTDGTLTGTFSINTINHSGDSDLGYLTTFKDTLFFRAYDGSDWELWSSDGTLTGTAKFLDINPGGSSSPSYLTVVSDTLFFDANDGFHGQELWLTDGTITGTRMVKDIHPTTSSQPRILGAIHQTLFFAADDGVHGKELWVSDGSVTGTVMVKDITEGITNTTFNWSAATDRNVFFVVDDAVIGRELWVSDGTETGTHLVTEINPTGHAFTDYQTAMTGHRHKVYFSATDGVHGVELWESDGTAEGTFMVKDINLSGDAIEFYVGRRKVMNETLFFSANDGNSGFELWALGLLAEISLSQETYFVDEEAGTATITVTLDYPVATRDVAFDYALIEGSATENEDFTALTGTLTIPLGDSYTTFTIPIIDDLIEEPDETVLIILSNPVNGYFSQPITKTLTIIDHDTSIFLPIILREPD